MVKYRVVAVAVAVSGGGAVAVAVAGLTKRFFNHIQKDFLINVWGYERFCDVLVFSAKPIDRLSRRLGWMRWTARVGSTEIVSGKKNYRQKIFGRKMFRPKNFSAKKYFA